MINTRKVLNNTVIVNQGERCKYIYFVNYGNFILLRNIDFIESVNYPLETYVQETSSADVDIQKEVTNIQKNMPFDDPSKYGNLVSYKSKLMQISELSKGRSFGDTNIEQDWI